MSVVQPTQLCVDVGTDLCVAFSVANEAVTSDSREHGSTPADNALKVEEAAEQLEVSDPSDFQSHASPPKTSIGQLESQVYSGVVKTSTQSRALRTGTEVKCHSAVFKR